MSTPGFFKVVTDTLLVPLEQIQYIDYPEILINEHERTEMPFRYVRGDDGQPIMPTVCFIAVELTPEPLADTI